MQEQRLEVQLEQGRMSSERDSTIVLVQIERSAQTSPFLVGPENFAVPRLLPKNDIILESLP